MKYISEVVLNYQPMVYTGFVVRPFHGITIDFYKSIGIVITNKKGDQEIIPWHGIKGVRMTEEPPVELK